MKPKADTAKDRGKVTLADLLESDRHQYPREDVQLTLSEFASANPVAGAGDEAVQVSGPGARFLSAFGIITSHFPPGRHLCAAGVYKALMKRRFAAWERVVGAQETV